MTKSLNVKTLFNNYQLVVFGFIVLSFGFDFINKIDIFYDLELMKYSKFFKIIFLLYALIFSIMHSTYIYKNFKLLCFTILLLSVIFLLKNNFSERYTIEYIRYVFPLSVFPLICFAYINRSRELLDKLYKFFKWFIILNTIFILVGLLFEIKAFRVYPFGRFGYNGVILSQGVTPYIYLCSITLFWVFKDKKMLILTIFVSILSGVKGVYFVEFLFFSLVVFFNNNVTKIFKIKILVTLFISFIISIIGLFLTPLFRNVIQSDGIFSAISSYRNVYTLNLLKEITPDNYNIFIGTITLQKVRLELLIIDLLLFFGITGLIAYLIFLRSLFKSLIKSNLSKFFFASILLLSLLSGNLLNVPLSLILMFLVLIALRGNSECKKLNNI